MDEYLEYRRFVSWTRACGEGLVSFPCGFLLLILFSACCNNNISDARQIHARIYNEDIKWDGFSPFFVSFLRTVADDDGGELLTTEDYTAYKSKIVPQRAKNRLYVSFAVPGGIECKLIGPETQCFCTHR